MSRPEIIIEKEHVRRARSQGAVCIKGKVEGRAAFPDQLILKPVGFYWIEFKSTTGTLQDDQVVMHRELRKKGHKVYVCSTSEYELRIFADEFLN